MTVTNYAISKLVTFLYTFGNVFSICDIFTLPYFYIMPNSKNIYSLCNPTHSASKSAHIIVARQKNFENLEKDQFF